MKFHYRLSSTAHVKGRLDIEAPTREEADAKMRENIGNVSWVYNGLAEDDSEVEIYEVTTKGK
jgi:hypothetical protein